MADEAAADEPTAPGPAKVAADRVKELRDLRRMSQADLHSALTALGILWHPVTVSKVERKVRDLDLGELFAFAAALNVSPTHLLDTDEPVAVTPNLTAPAARVRAWLRGEAPITPDADLDEYFAAAPEDEQRAHRVAGHGAMRKEAALRTMLRAALDRNPDRIAAGTLADALERDYDELGDYVKLLVRELRREAADDVEAD